MSLENRPAVTGASRFAPSAPCNQSASQLHQLIPQLFKVGLRSVPDSKSLLTLPIGRLRLRVSSSLHAD